MNQKQKDMLEYMKEVLNQEDDYVLSDAWEIVEWFVLDALSYEDDENKCAP